MTRFAFSVCLFLAVRPLFSAPPEDAALSEARQRLTRLSSAVKKYRTIFGKGPEELSELHYKVLVDDLSLFVLPNSGMYVDARTQINSQSDFTLEPVAGVKDILVREESPHLKPGHVLAAFADGSIRFVPLPVETTGLPQGLTLERGLSAKHWMTVRRITDFKPDEVGTINSLKMSGNGKRIVFSAAKGIFILSSEGPSRPIQVADKPKQAIEMDFLATSERGDRVAWLDGDQVFVADADGRGKLGKIAEGSEIKAIRMTAKGDRLVFLAHTRHNESNRALWSVPTDGSKKATKLVDWSKELREMNWKGYSEGLLDISDDGSHIVFSFRPDDLPAQAVSLDVKTGRMMNLSQLERGQGGVSHLSISGNGTKVAFHVAYPRDKQPGLTIVDWDGKNRVSYPSESYLGPNQMNDLQMAQDGSKALTSGTAGLHLCSCVKAPVQHITHFDPKPLSLLIRTRAGIWGPVRNHWAANQRRGCAIVSDESQLSLIELNPEVLTDTPLLKDLSVFPRRLPVDGKQGTTVSARPEGPALEYIGVRVFRASDLDANIVLGATPQLKEDSDRKKKDGIFATQYSTYDLSREKPAPLTFRVFAYDKRGNLLVVDVEGIKSK